jgi:GxxExxY protein
MESESENEFMQPKVLYPTESYAITGACFTVYNEKGCGFLESVFQECLEIEFEHLRIPFQAQKKLQLTYRGRPLRNSFAADFVCYDSILVELKAVSTLTDEHRAQVLNYLSASGLTLGILVNFGHYPRLEYERMVLTSDRARPKLSRLCEDDAFRAVAWKQP